MKLQIYFLKTKEALETQQEVIIKPFEESTTSTPKMISSNSLNLKQFNY